MKLLIAGVDQEGHVGRFLRQAAIERGIDVRIADTRRAMEGPRLARSLFWRLGRRPLRLGSFSRETVAMAEDFRPDVLLSTGIAPLAADALRRLSAMGIRLVNDSTDDPWSTFNRSAWFMEALGCYDAAFTPRRSNLADFLELGLRDVRWLPFGYAPEVHFRDDSDAPQFVSDVAFVGGADADRVPLIASLIRAGHRVSLWGGYWHRFAETRAHARGHADAATLRKVLSHTKCALTLVRRSNRDGHAMRTYEVAAVGAPVLAEDTEEHREILGEDGDAALFFRNESELLDRCAWFVAHPHEGRAMGARLMRRIREGKNTYGDRLDVMLGNSPDPSCR